MSQSALPPNDKEMSLIQHLLELRDALTKGVLAIVVVFFILFPFANDLYVYISEPLTHYLPDDTSMIATGVASPFLTPFKLTMVLAVYLAMPYLLYQIWRFISPALYTHERQLVGPILFFSSFLFYAGGAFAYYVVFPLVFGFLSTTAPEGVTIATDIALYLDFVIKMFFAFGIAFEVPIVTVLLILTGMASVEKLKHARPYVIVGAFVIGMLLTPPDIISQTLLAVPMWLLYEIGVVVGDIVKKRRDKAKSEREAAEEQAFQDSLKGSNSSASNDDDDPEPTPPTGGGKPTPPQPGGGQNSVQPETTATQAQPKTEPNPEPEDIEFDDRYADQLEDDEDWDVAFEEIENEISQLDKQYEQKRRQTQFEKQKPNKEGKTDSTSLSEPQSTNAQPAPDNTSTTAQTADTPKTNETSKPNSNKNG